MLKSSLANIAEYPSAFRIYEEETGKEIITCGSGIESPYFSARMLVQAGLSACLAGSVLGALTKAGISVDDVNATVDMELVENARPIMHTNVELIGVEQGKEEEAKKVMELAVSNCFISNLLSQGFEIAHSEAEKRITIRDNGPCCGL